MKISQLDLPSPAIDFLTGEGFTKLYPPQAQAVKAGLVGGKSVLVSAPTASGKTLIATIAMLSYLSGKPGKAVYLSPLRALASEKYAEFKKLERVPVGGKIRVGMSTGDSEGAEKNLGKNNIIILTNEKMDSLIRHGLEWLDDIGLVIADEVHLIGDQDRGPTLEMILAKIKRLEPRPQIVGLSATVTNAGEISGWLGSELVKSDWRPVPLSEGVYDYGTVTMSNGRHYEIDPTLRGPPVDLGAESVKNGGQSLLFAETRIRASSMATKASGVISKMLEDSQLKDLEKVSKKILGSNEHTKVVKTLAELVKKGVAFHHAGLNQNCRATIESEFRKGTIRLLCSTPTLAAGVNLPARRVVISSVNRYNVRMGASMPISILEYKQLCGRAGRPQYDKFGEAIIVGKSNTDDLMDYYINGEPEPIESRITDERALRIHTLSLVSTSPGIKRDELVDFFLGTLGGVQSGKAVIKFGVRTALRFLLKEGLLVQKSDRYAATEFGKQTSMLYIDPITATNFRDAIQSTSKRRRHTLGFLHLITTCEEFFPKFGLRQGDYELAGLLLERRAAELIEPVSEDDCNRSLLALDSWIGESTEVSLSENLKIESGDIHRMTENANWLLYCLRQIAKHSERADLLAELDALRGRISYGIKEELLGLVRIKGIGRIRARVLHKNGIKNLDALSAAPLKKLAAIDKIGPRLAGSIKSQL